MIFQRRFIRKSNRIAQCVEQRSLEKLIEDDINCKYQIWGSKLTKVDFDDLKVSLVRLRLPKISIIHNRILWPGTKVYRIDYGTPVVFQTKRSGLGYSTNVYFVSQEDYILEKLKHQSNNS